MKLGYSHIVIRLHIPSTSIGKSCAAFYLFISFFPYEVTFHVTQQPFTGKYHVPGTVLRIEIRG